MQAAGVMCAIHATYDCRMCNACTLLQSGTYRALLHAAWCCPAHVASVLRVCVVGCLVCLWRLTAPGRMSSQHAWCLGMHGAVAGCGHVSATTLCCATHAINGLLVPHAEMPFIVKLSPVSAALLCCSTVFTCCSPAACLCQHCSVWDCHS